jgi:hypothetical protein
VHVSIHGRTGVPQRGALLFTKSVRRLPPRVITISLAHYFGETEATITRGVPFMQLPRLQAMNW